MKIVHELHVTWYKLYGKPDSFQTRADSTTSSQLNNDPVSPIQCRKYMLEKFTNSTITIKNA